jgi:hypothetical protein
MNPPLGDILVIWANGFLATVYWVWENAAVLLSIGLAWLILLHYDREVRRVAGERTLRYGRGQIVRASHRSHYETLAALILWVIAALLMAPPIPFIGLLMWAAFWAALRWIPQEREQILFRQKVMIAIYAGLLLAFRIVTSYAFDAGQLITMMGGDGDAAGVFATVRGSLVPYAVLVLWAMYPLGYFVTIGQRFMVNRGSLTRPGQTVAQTLEDLRTRGER